jgi:antibiotic biosynthesis monooxygenase (ABM) superfamily enzyme
MENGNRCMGCHLPNHHNTISSIGRLFCPNRVITLAYAAITAIAVPLMVYIVLPLLQKAVARWLNN